MARRIVDLTGKRFGKLVVVEVAGRDKHKRVTWKCLCDCGNEVVIRSNNLRTGNSESCGCEKWAKNKTVRNLTGEKFGRLVVLERDNSITGKVYWICKCECSNQTTVWMGHLVTGHTKSCGCLKNEQKNTVPKRSSAKTQRWSVYIRNINGNKCMLCGASENLHAHHLDSYLENEERRFDIDNGVCLCQRCHWKFHRRYGFGNAKAEDFHEFAGLPPYERDLIEIIDVDEALKGRKPKWFKEALEMSEEPTDLGRVVKLILNAKNLGDLKEASFYLNRFVERSKQK
ncbi:hypothetical protein QNH23_06350 [Siminovitchia fortis]|uniref:HNH domain-containing protein n=1 Tax=Siminovitchia fortis TaxID=254758 RepID=A0A443IN18_9BACI|nr:HNH endonuclease [Siminovitchia fortis]RWR06726.1 hypothetical protein D4N35_013755 [Siminovitchia fortis]WHY82992.1 hypothetical protein QNH23_06350 [Siminovitchia fortis]